MKSVLLGLAAGLLIIFAFWYREYVNLKAAQRLSPQVSPSALSWELLEHQRNRLKKKVERSRKRVRDRLQKSAREGFEVQHLEPKFKTVNELVAVKEYEMALEYLNLIEVQIPRKETRFLGYEEK